MGSLSLSATMAAVVFGVGLVLASGGVSVPVSCSGLVASEPPVLVVVLGSRDAVDDVRRALRPEHIVADSGGAVAVAGGRILAADLAAASEPLNRAGWADRPVEILRVRPRDPRPGSAVGSETAPAPGSAEHLAALVQKPTLSRGEQLAVLRALNEGAL